MAHWSVFCQWRQINKKATSSNTILYCPLCHHYQVFPNRVETNMPRLRIPFGLFGCGSWNGDSVVVNPFDRGAFGFHRVRCGALGYLCFMWPCFGEVIARQRCQWNGPLWHGGLWCDEWPCDMLCCTYRYAGLADGDEAAFASNIALQAYFEGRKITAQDMEKCLEYWRQHVSEFYDPEGKKRGAMCEPCYVPCFPSSWFYRNLCQRQRIIPSSLDASIPQVKEAYDKYERLRQKQTQRWINFRQPRRLSTICQVFGCRRFFGRKGFLFCTEGCNDNPRAGCCYRNLHRQSGGPFPPPAHPDWEDDHDAVRVLQAVLGDPPRNVVYQRWEWDDETKGYVVVKLPIRAAASTGDEKEHLARSSVGSIHHKAEILQPDLDNPMTPSLEVVNNEGSALPSDDPLLVTSPVTLFKGSY